MLKFGLLATLTAIATTKNWLSNWSKTSKQPTTNTDDQTSVAKDKTTTRPLYQVIS